MMKKFVVMTALALAFGTVAVADDAATACPSKTGKDQKTCCTKAQKPAQSCCTKAKKQNKSCCQQAQSCEIKSGSAGERSFWAQFGRSALLYLPNRLIDLSDLFTVQLGAGSAFGAKVKVTNGFELGGTNGTQYFLGKGFNRQVGGGCLDSSDFGLLCWQREMLQVSDTFGYYNEFYFNKDFSLADNNLPPYQNGTLDFWSIGATVGVGVVGDFQLHLQELPDAILGFFCLDPDGDDLK
ncbi:MAG: hypothetical protein PHQ27_00630 [Victivallales bacterium]|nr:hypothetical protein [Victivallales bacterium]